MIRILQRPEFAKAVEARLAWLGEHRSEDQLDLFLSGLRSARSGIARYPRAGRVLKQSATYTLRLRLFPRPLPYLVYYAHANADPIKTVFLVRLYASGQRRAAVEMREWHW